MTCVAPQLTAPVRVAPQVTLPLDAHSWQVRVVLLRCGPLEGTRWRPSRHAAARCCRGRPGCCWRGASRGRPPPPGHYPASRRNPNWWRVRSSPCPAFRLWPLQVALVLDRTGRNPGRLAFGAPLELSCWRCAKPLARAARQAVGARRGRLDGDGSGGEQLGGRVVLGSVALETQHLDQKQRLRLGDGDAVAGVGASNGKLPRLDVAGRGPRISPLTPLVKPGLGRRIRLGFGGGRLPRGVRAGGRSAAPALVAAFCIARSGLVPAGRLEPDAEAARQHRHQQSRDNRHIAAPVAQGAANGGEKVVERKLAHWRVPAS